MRRRGACLVLAAALAGCGGQERPALETAGSDPGLVHIHGLGVNPADGALYIATHTGLFRIAEGARTPERVGTERQDTMGFTVVGPDRFLGSGHPDPGSELPPFLGLIASGDAGASWAPRSLLGEVDFHVLEASGSHVYGFGSDFERRAPAFLVSADGGRSWDERAVPEPLVSLAIDPRDPRHVVASGERQILASTDAGRTWRPLAGGPALLAWAAPDALHAVAFDGATSVSADGGRTWDDTGHAGGAPAAFEAAAGALYVALHDGTIRRSADGGRSWALRAAP